MPYQRSSRRESERGNRMSSPHANNPSGNHQAPEPASAPIVPPIEQWRPAVELHELQRRSLRERIEFIVDTARMAGFESLADVFLAQLRTVSSRGTHGCDVVCSIVSSSPYEPIRKLLNAYLQFQAYIGTVTQNIAKREILKLTLNVALRLPSRAMDPSRIESFNMVTIDKEHQRDAPFLRSLLRVIVNSSSAVISKDFDDSDRELPKLANNMHGDFFLLLEEKTPYRCNRATVAVAVMCMLCYACNERSNLFQAVNGHLSFAHNVPKRYIEIFHQLGIIVLYESIRRTLNANALAVKKALQEKATKKRFFISYDNMNFYEKARDQRLHNRGALLSYTTGYVCFMNTPESSTNSDNNWYERYLNADQVDREAVNDVKSDDLKLNSIALNHRSATIRHIASEVLSRYFGQAMQKEKIWHRDGKS